MKKHCKNCKIETERNTDGKCKPCTRQRSAKYHANNKDKSAAYYVINKDKIDAASAKYYANNKDRAIAYYKANNVKIAKYRAENKEKRAAYYENYYIGNKAKVLAASAKNRADNPEYGAKYRAANRERFRIYEQNRNARKLKNGGSLSQGLAGRLFSLQRGLCPCCKQSLGKDYHLDHITPISKGGANEDWNMQLLRSACNRQKSALHPVDFMQSRGFLL